MTHWSLMTHKNNILNTQVGGFLNIDFPQKMHPRSTKSGCDFLLCLMMDYELTTGVGSVR